MIPFFFSLTFTFHCKPLSSVSQFLACQQTLFFFLISFPIELLPLQHFFEKFSSLVSIIMLIHREYRNQIFTNFVLFNNVFTPSSLNQSKR